MKISGNQRSLQLTERILTDPSVRSVALAGPDYVGKRSFAESAMERLFGPEDVLRADSGVDGARDVRDFLRFRPSFGARRAVLVDEADRLSEPAQDAYLKVCEDGAGSCVVVLVSSDLESLLPALRSRLDSVVRWSPLSPEEMSAAFPESGEPVLRLCSGRPGLHSVVSSPAYQELHSAALSVISGRCGSPVPPLPEAIRSLKGSRSPERDAAALVLRLAARELSGDQPLSGRVRAALRLASVLESVPSASAEVHWQAFCLLS